MTHFWALCSDPAGLPPSAKQVALPMFYAVKQEFVTVAEQWLLWRMIGKYGIMTNALNEV